MKKFGKNDVFRNPWNIGDLYAYRFHKSIAKKHKLLNHYIVLQKIADIDYCDDLKFSAIRVYNHIFEKIPTLQDINQLPILPLCTDIGPDGRKMDPKFFIPSFDWYKQATMMYLKDKEFPREHLFFIDNIAIPPKEWLGNQLSDMFWRDFEELIIEYWLSWNKQ